MKNKHPNLLMGLFVFCSISAKSQTVVNAGIWQTFGKPLVIATNPEIKGRLCNFYWRDLETSPGVWNWTSFDADLTSRTDDGLPVIFMVYTKEDAPDWLYTNGVPKVNEKDDAGVVTGYAPYYADTDYKAYFRKMVIAVRKHVETLPSNVRNNITGVQGCFGSTGDYISYKGTVAPQYDLTTQQFSDLFREFSQYYYDEYKNTNPAITLLSNPRNNGSDDNIWVVQNCPGWLKCGTLGKAFQINDELDKSTWLYSLLNQPQPVDYVRARSEMSGTNTSTGWWKKMPYKNMFATMCYGIHWGLDWPNQGNSQIEDLLYDTAYNFFNKYAGQKNPAKSTNAMCFLKDVLDASDAVRFPAATFGTVDRTSTQRYQNIVNSYAAYGAVLQDAKSATLGEQDMIYATGTNDVGWNLFAANYERYLHQLTPNSTSIGYWNVSSADPTSMFGKFARSFDVANNKKALYFDVDNAFLLNAPLNSKYSVTISVTYLDGDGGWQLFYDSKSKADKVSLTVIGTKTNTWKKAVVTLSNAYFGNRGPSASDFSIRSTNSKNVIFAVVELSRPANFAGKGAAAAVSTVNNAAAAVLVAASNVQPGMALSISPNPATDQFHISLNDGSTITNVEIVNQLGQVVLQKNISAGIITISRREIGGNAGVYYLKVFAGKRIYTGKVIIQ